jgi:N-methylhydantoinase A
MKSGAEARVGLDAGGTFTDAIVLDSNATARALKAPSDAPAAEILSRCKALVAPGRPGAVVSGTTRITNAVLEGRLARTALVTTAGFRDVLAIGRQARDDLYDLRRAARVPPPVPRALCFEAAERLAADGTAVLALNDKEAQSVAAAVRKAGVEAVAVCLLHSYANPEHERLLAEALGDDVFLSLSHRVSREQREFERASTTALNAAVMPAIDAYLGTYEDALSRVFPDVPSFVVHSAGGMMDGDRARLLPLATVMSGPAAGVAATARLARRLGLTRVVSVDMGGTSTDVCLLRDGVPASARDRRLAGHAVRLPAVAIETIGAGGGSIAWVDDVGALHVGPQSAGADPGPASYGRGGVEATVTDADVVLGLAGGFGGELELDAKLASEACERLGTRLGLSAVEAARAVAEATHAEMERALRLVTVRRGHDLRAHTLVAFGGAGPMHAGAVALSAGVERVVVPALSSTFSALGCCLSELTIEDVETCLAVLDDEDWPRVRAELERLVGEVVGALADDGDGALRASRSLELRYQGQNEALDVATDERASPADVRGAFHERHLAEFGYATEEQVQVTAVRARVWRDEGTAWARAEPTAPPDVRIGETGFGPVLARGGVEPGRRVEGPAVLADGLSTVVVWPGLVARTDADANVWLERP